VSSASPLPSHSYGRQECQKKDIPAYFPSTFSTSKLPITPFSTDIFAPQNPNTGIALLGRLAILLQLMILQIDDPDLRDAGLGVEGELDFLVFFQASESATSITSSVSLAVG
jgi:hypothetical protein